MRGDILACWGNSWLDRLIVKTTGSKISHIAIMRNDNEIIESINKGLQINPLSTKSGNYIQLRYRWMNLEKADKVIGYLEEHLGNKFDIMQLFDIWFYRTFRVKLGFSNPEDWICIESIWNAFFNALNVDLLPQVLDKRYMEPGDILKSPEILIVGGKIN